MDKLVRLIKPRKIFYKCMNSCLGVLHIPIVFQAWHIMKTESTYLNKFFLFKLQQGQLGHFHQIEEL